MNIRTLILLATASVTLAACTKVPSGNVGVKAYLLGSEKGVDTEVLGPGRYYIGFNEELFLFPTFTQTVSWVGSVETDEGNTPDQRITFQDVDGLKISAGVGLTYSVDKAKVALLYQKYRRGPEEITNVYLRNMIRDALVIESSKMKVDDIYGRGKEELIVKVQDRVRAQVAPYGINIERIYWADDMALPSAVLAALNAKIAATQQAQQRENQVRTAEAQGRIDVAKATGEAEARVLRANAEATSNRIVAASITPELVRYQIAKTWDGKLPQVTDGSQTIVDLR